MKKILILLITFLTLNTTVIASSIDSDLNNLISKTDELRNSIFLNNHPKGSIYETTQSDENTVDKMHSKYGGTWEVYGENRVLRGTTNEIKEVVNNNEKLKISTSQIPSLTVSGSKPAQTITSGSSGSGYSVSYTYSTRTTTTNGGHSHSYSTGGNAIVVGSSSSATAKNYGFENVGSGYWSGHRKQITGIANDGAHSHTANDYYTTGDRMSGIDSHTHSITLPAQTITSTYTNNSQTKIDIKDAYITVYRYKRLT